ncbi:MAG TPA: hypothetical protein VFT91_06860 [Dehalococcoidia bacterium]|nr:hypothetical protein [Dehalococcoidia bacterium]
MPEQETATAARVVCPTCRAPVQGGAALYGASGGPIAPNGGTPAPAAPQPTPVAPAAVPAPWHLPTYSLQFWQGLAAGLAAGIVILFLVALAA